MTRKIFISGLLLFAWLLIGGVATTPLHAQTGPGGVGDAAGNGSQPVNALWLRADKGITTYDAPYSDQVETWADQSGNGNDASWDDGDPALLNDALNGEPAVEFGDRQNSDSFSGEDALDFSSTQLDNLATGDNTLILVSKSTGDAENRFALDFDNSNGGTDLRAVGYNARLGVDGTTGNLKLVAISGDNTDREVWSQTASTSEPHIVSSVFDDGGTPRHDLIFNNSYQRANDRANPIQDAADEVLLGKLSADTRTNLGDSAPDGFFNGDLAEVIAYDETLNSAQVRILHNYLAEKYDIDVANDFYSYSSSGTDVAGLGQADSSFGEAPKGSHTVANAAELRLSTNASTSFNDGEYILFGHDDAAVSFSQIERPNGKTTAQKTDREWRVDLKDAASQSVDVSIAQGDLPALPSGFNDYAIFVDGDGDFSSGATFVDLEQNGTRYEASGVTISDGDHVTIAAIERTITFVKDSESDFENTSTSEPALSLELNYPNQSGLTLGYDVSPGANSPTNDTDYETCCEPAQSATFSFPVNQTTYDLQQAGSPAFRILDEGIAEDNTEFVDIAVDPSSGAGSGLVAGGNATTLEFGIVDDDQSRTASLGADDSKGEGSGSSFTVNVTLSSNASGSDVTVDYELSGSATAGEDYENQEAGSVDATSGSVIIPDGGNSTSFTLKILDDDTFETDETIDVTLVSAEGGATLKNNSGDFPSQTFTITDDEAKPTVAFSASSFTGTEGTRANATVQLSAAAGTSIDVQFSASDGSATSGDYSTATSSPVTIPAGQTEVPIAFDLTSGDGKETTETFSVTLTSASPADFGTQTSADFDIIDADGVGGEGPGGVGNDQSLAAWLAADQLSLSDGSEVTTWPDQSGNGNDASVTAGNGPDFQSSVPAFDDQPVVRFTSANSDYLNLSGIDNLGNGANTVFAVSETDADDQQGILTVSSVDPFNGTTTDRRNLRYNIGTVAEALNGDSGANQTASTGSVSSDGTPSILGSVFDGSDVDVAADRESPATAPDTDAGSGTSAVLGTEITVSGSSEDQTNFLNGDIAEFVAFNQALNPAQRTIVANYLAAKYGISLSSNDYYAGDTNAGFDQNVVGIGAEGSTLSDQHTQASGAGGMRLVVNNFSSGEYVFVGDTTYAAANDISINDVSGVSNTTARSDHLRYLETKGQPTFDITVNLEKFGLKGPAGEAANYRLLYRGSSGGSGDWSTPATVGGRSTNGDKVTFSGVQFGASDEAVYITIGTTNQVASPIDTRLTVVRGNAGADQTDEGWRYYGPPGRRDSGPVQMGEIRLRTPSGNVQTVDFRRNMSYTWSRASGTWLAASGDTDVPVGRGAILFLYDDKYVPIDPEVTIDPKESGTNGSFSYTTDTDVTVGDAAPTTADSALAESVNSHLLANPYGVTYDLRALQTLNQDGDGDGTNDWSTAVQVWSALDGEDAGDPRGTYKVRSTDPAKPQSERLIGPGQAFFLERSDQTNDGGGLKTEIMFSADGRQEDELTDFVGTQKSAGAASKTRRAGQIKLRLQVRNDDEKLLARDRAASLYFREEAGPTWDAFDAPKLTPMEQAYATIAVKGAAQDGSTIRKAQESRSYAIEETMEVPLALTVEGVSGKATLSAPEWWSIPSDWVLTLVDTKGTSDPSDDVEHELRRNGQNAYTFSVGEEKQRETNAASATSEGSSPVPPSQIKQDDASASKSTASSDTRFRLRVTPNAGQIPVEMADLSAQTEGRSVVLQWSTASETNNAGFYVERRRRSEDSTGAPASEAWERSTFVEGSGTTDSPQEYRHKVADLEYGTHAFRLRQVDTDGSETVTDVVEAAVRLDGSHSVSAPYPNPVRGQTTLEVTVREPQPVRVELYDVLGRRVRTVRDKKLSAQSTRRVQIRTSNLSSGTYFLRVEGEHFTETRRIAVVQ